jgi:Tannase and feruloyl esterase
MLAAIALLIATIVGEPSSCENLEALALQNTTIVSAQWVSPGPFTPPAVPGTAAPATQGPSRAPIVLPPHCRVTVVMKPSSDSHIEMEVWLPPSENWNGKFQAVGNGGWAGTISYPDMARALKEGYATASTDTGHKGGNALFAIGHPEKLIDFGYRAVHEMAVRSKAIIASYYQRAARLSYWNGCSTGGRQGLMSAQKYPEDFDAIAAGAPANYHTHLQVSSLARTLPLLKDPSGVVPARKLALVTRAVLDSCDARDGVKDDLLNEPRACAFDVATLQCKGGDADTCLTAAQVAAVKRAYAPVTLSNGHEVFPGKDPGSETAWGSLTDTPFPLALGSLQIAHGDANWDLRTIDLERDLRLVDEKVGVITNAINPDLRAFKDRGGKLLLYHGWNDPLISAGNTINYYNAVLHKMGRDQQDWIRLFMAPGMGHCGGGQGPSQAHWMAALERWRESGQPPATIEAARITGNRVDMTRPLCPYPQVARYTGVGSTNDAPNFVCQP